MTLARRFWAGALLLVLVTVAGAVGYVTVEDLGVVDAIYTTVITISTVGFTEPRGGFSQGGQILTIVVILAGVGAVLYTATAGIEMGIEAFVGGERQRRRMEREIAGLRDHIVVCGFGRIGRNVHERLAASVDERPVLVIDDSPERAESAREHGALVLEGDATRDEVLEAAGIDRASVLLACVRSDADNLFIVLSARSRRPDLLIIARATEAESERKLLLAGANRVVAPQVVGALRLAALAVQPDVADFIDLMVEGQVLEFRVERFEVVEGAAAVGSTLGQARVRSTTGTLVLAVQEEGRIALNPSPDFVIRAGQVLYGIGTHTQVEQLRKILCEV